MVHAAIHDAVQAYDGRFEPYAVAITGASGSPVAAIAKAAHDVLVNRFPAKTVRSFRLPSSFQTASHSTRMTSGQR